MERSLKEDIYVLKYKYPKSLNGCAIGSLLSRTVIQQTYNTFGAVNKITYITIGLSTIQLCLSRSLLSFALSYAEFAAVIWIVSYRSVINEYYKIGYKLDIVRIVAIVSPVSIAARFFVNAALSPVYFLPLVVVFWFMAYLFVKKRFHDIMRKNRSVTRYTFSKKGLHKETYRDKDSDKTTYLTVLEGDYDGAIVLDEKYRLEDFEKKIEREREYFRKSEEDRKRREEEAQKKKGTFENLSENERKRARRPFFDESILKTPPKPRNRRIGFGWYDEETYQNYLRDHELGPYSPDYKEKNPQPKSKEETGGYVEIEDDNTSVDRFKNKR